MNSGHVHKTKMILFLNKTNSIIDTTQFTHQQKHYLLIWLKVLNLH